jgi:katanin p60 ATPase-containing subunit A1
VRIHAHASARDRPLIISRSQAFERDSLRAEERERALLVLARRFLADNGFAESARCLARESDASLSRSDAAPDAHLRGVLREWQDARERATGVRPRLTSRKSETGKGVAARAAAPGRAGATAGAERRAARLAAEREALRAKAAMLDVKDEEDKQKRNEASKASRVNDRGPSFPNAARVDDDGGVDDVFSRAPPGHPLLRRYAQEGGVSEPPPGGTALSNALEYFANRKREPELEGGGDVGPASTIGDDDDDWASRRRVLRPLPSFGGDAELRGLAKTLTRDIFVSNPNVRWGDVAGLGEAKRLLREAVVMPARFPQFFTGLLRPWRGVLLYGPPGTGKTMLAKAVATECGTTFFNISASSIVSKWRGDSEKLVRVLFELAQAPRAEHGVPGRDRRRHVYSRRRERRRRRERPRSEPPDEDGTPDSTRRFTHATRLCGGEEINADERETHAIHPLVFLLAATNTPWSLDPALLRRLEKRVSVGLPDGDARAAIALGLFRSRDVAEPRDSVLEPLATKTEGYSGSDIATLCKEAAMRPLRRLMARLDDVDGDGGGGSVSDAEKATVGPVTAEDVAGALAQSRSTHTQTHARRYEEWTRSFGMDAG